MERERSLLQSPVSLQGRVLVDERSGALRSWFDPDVPPLVTPPFAPREVAREVLRLSAQLLGWPSTLPNIQDGPVLGIAGGISVRFTQEFRGLPVVASEVVVNMHGDGRLHSLYNQYHYDIPPALDPRAVTVSAVTARALVARLSSAYKHRTIGPPRLVVLPYQPEDRGLPVTPRRPNPVRGRFLRAVQAELARARRHGEAPIAGHYYIAWQFALHTFRPLGSWVVWVNAVTGRLIAVHDAVSYADGKAKVFDPNPIVESGDLSLSSETPRKRLNALRVPVTVERLDPPDSQGRLRLHGAWVHMEDFAVPDFAEPTSKSGHFVFSSGSRKFLDAMAYHHIDRFQQYLQTELALVGVADTSIMVDPQGENGSDLSQATGAAIVFGEGGVPDAADAMVILHEYGHAIQHALNPGSNSNDFASGETEGMSDFLAAVYFDHKQKNVDPPTRGLMFSWNFNPTDFPGRGRRYDLPAPAAAGEWSQGTGYQLAPLWSSATFELYRKLGGDSPTQAVKLGARNLAIRLHLMAHAKIPGSNATVTQAAQEIEAADGDVAPWWPANGLHVKVIHDTFTRRRVPGFAAKTVDVYVDDGRRGGYGAVDGNDDDFQNILWLKDHRKTTEIWTRLAPYPSGATPSPEDHEPPEANQAAFVYVRVGNRGTANSGGVKLRTFAAPPQGGLVWPSAWTELPELPAPPAPPVQPADVPAGGSAIAGPFTWTPAKRGKALLLAVVECGLDRAVTESLKPTDRVPIMDLVPFDNNIAMREISVTP